MHSRTMAWLTAALITGTCVSLAFTQAVARDKRDRGQPAPDHEEVVRDFARAEFEKGRRVFRYETFGDEVWWGDALQLHRALEGSAHGGVGSGVSPATALAVGLKVDVDALPQSLQLKLKRGLVDLADPATTLALLKLDAVVGVTGRFNPDGTLKTMGIQCALCHSTVDNSLAPGIGRRLDGWANRDLDVGAIVGLAPRLEPMAEQLGVDVATVRTVLASWGPGKFDAALVLDGKAFGPDGKSGATLIPPAFGLGGINLHTWTGWGSVPHWNAFVAVLEMHGQGSFQDARLDNAAQFPLAARNRLGHVTHEPDRVSSLLPALHYYQLSLPAPAPPSGSFDQAAATRGEVTFNGKARCASCHTRDLGSEPGWNMHRAADIGVDAFQADRSPEHAYRTAPLKGLWTHMTGGFYHDGRFATLLDVVNHYDGFFRLGLAAGEKSDVVEYLKSLSDDVPTSVRDRASLNQEAGTTEQATAAAERTGGLSIWPLPATAGAGVQIGFLSPARLAGKLPADLKVSVYDLGGRRVAEIGTGAQPVEHAMITVTWDGKDSDGAVTVPGVYFVRASAPSVGFQTGRRIVVR